MGSVVAMLGLSCLAACGILVPWLGIEPTSPALHGGFLTTGTPEKSLLFYINKELLSTSTMWKYIFIFTFINITKMETLKAIQANYLIFSFCSSLFCHTHFPESRCPILEAIASDVLWHECSCEYGNGPAPGRSTHVICWKGAMSVQISCSPCGFLQIHRFRRWMGQMFSEH